MKVLGELVSIGTLAAFVTVCLGVLVLRRTRPDLPRPFRTPWPWFVCIAGAVVCGAMMVSLGPATWARLVIWTGIGVAHLRLLRLPAQLRAQGRPQPGGCRAHRLIATAPRYGR